MTRTEIQAEIKAQKALIDAYAEQVDAVISASITVQAAQEHFNTERAILANRCRDLSQTMKKLGMSIDSVKRFLPKDTLFHVQQELNR